jgi:hypothetical protein
LSDSTSAASSTWGAGIADAQSEPFTGPVPYLVERFTAEVIPAVRGATAKG